MHVLGGQVEPQQQHGGLVSRRGWWFRSKVERGKVEGLVLFGRRDAEDSGKFAEGFEVSLGHYFSELHYNRVIYSPQGTTVSYTVMACRGTQSRAMGGL